MAWYWWVLVWVVLVLSAGGFLAVLGFSIYGKLKLLFKELAVASERLEVVTDGLQELADRSAEPAVFTPASQLRQERFLDGRRREGRHAAEVRRASTRATQQRVR